MVGLVNGLERKELVQRLPHATDCRAVLVHLTEAGRELLQRGYALSDQFVQRFFRRITPEEQELLLAILKRLAANANEDAETGDSNQEQ
jgi:DNA-binding MarR family transcriptional regulator